MSEYKGFISWETYKELCNLLDSIADFRGIKNSIDHLRLPDTDMNDKICEDFDYIKHSLIRRLMERVNDTLLLAIKIAKLEEEK